MSRTPPSDRPLELWIGVECTFNRVHDRYLNQLTVCGHDERHDDLDLLAQLGARRIRYPVLWEQVAPDHPDDLHWDWTDQRLATLRARQLEPIATLLHHGSGPQYTDMLDPAFPEKLAAYARKVAERYPWLTAYTPVNEPLTTARFSGLYGVWYPHHTSDESFIRMLLNECRGTVLAMRAIREVQPNAELVQTDDLGKAHATPAMQHEADFQNERRWLAYDLLCGRVDQTHPLWPYLLNSGATPQELQWFRANPCPPDIVGVDYYVTSERFLDERTDRYRGYHQVGPTHADVEAVRVYHNTAGIEQLLREVWARYELPVAITEAHLGSTREEQMRWFEQFWKAAQQVRAEGADIRAVTSWAILGSFDWNTLHTDLKGYYEPGAFDVRSCTPRPTALARVLQARAANTEPEHPVLNAPGFWERADRFFYPPVGDAPATTRPAGTARPLLILGGGRLGRTVQRLCAERGLSARLLRSSDVDLADASAVQHLLTDLRPWAVVNAAGYGGIDEAEVHHEAFWRHTAVGLAVLARACEANGVHLLTFSSDQVFGGDRTSPYQEHDAAHPVNRYGRARREAEWQVLAYHPGTLVVRSSAALFGASGRQDLLGMALRTLRAGGTLFMDDQHRFSPTYLPDLVHTSLDLLIDGERGTWHLTNAGETSWADLTRMLADATGAPADAVQAVPTEQLGWVAPRPRYSAMSSGRGNLMPKLSHALERYLANASD
ncbi:family 1 glycosylhydrolase [Deinococcus maricopensis]|uniref:dTDP-4-dehydrorhamnose reductase n=1 Tax=Deinococcus maricopensis (strain DSM 21211 / LMG 22137 / NRRL B-23946 / LB-34) TaxID=709986 RepID=E8U4D4_DEIML|nr:family 1 glycosylhydrolase [Deinococcus maricopensis]ADV65971.1 dTDP-4-dehydrorhamnose reductase [Deinococcus maricopensis DSM 21211]